MSALCDPTGFGPIQASEICKESAAILAKACKSQLLFFSISPAESSRWDLFRPDSISSPPISKIEACLKVRNIEGFDRGRSEVQRVVELTKARNEHVHPKIASIRTEMGMPQDGGKDWLFPFNLDGEHWPQLKIPKRSMFWSSDDALTVLKTVAVFLRYLFVSLLKFADDDFANLFSLRVEFANVRMPMVFEELLEELRSVSADGVVFPFFDASTAEKNKPPGSTPVP